MRRCRSPRKRERGKRLCCDARQPPRVRLPSTEHQLVHLIGHSQIGHRGHAYGPIMLRDRLEAAASLHWLPESIDWQAMFSRFEASGYRRPLLVLLPSLGDGGFYSVPVPGRTNLLTAIQRRRIALQARSAAMTRISLQTVWYAVLLEMQLVEHNTKWAKIVQTAGKFLLDEGEARIAGMFACGGPRPW
jgi:hypothetical protein